MVRHRKSLLLHLLLSTLLLSSCDPAHLGTRDVPTAPQTSRSTQNSEHQYTFVEAERLLSIQRTVQLIGGEGGELELLGHTLSVPAGAVAEPTLFRMLLLPNGRIEVKLTALTGNASATPVGADGFRDGKTVRLTLSYAKATNVDDPSRLVVLYLADGGAVEEVPTTVDTETKTVTVELEHFSRYCMAMD